MCLQQAAGDIMPSAATFSNSPSDKPLKPSYSSYNQSQPKQDRGCWVFCSTSAI